MLQRLPIRRRILLMVDALAFAHKPEPSNSIKTLVLATPFLRAIVLMKCLLLPVSS